MEASPSQAQIATEPVLPPLSPLSAMTQWQPPLFPCFHCTLCLLSAIERHIAPYPPMVQAGMEARQKALCAALDDLTAWLSGDGQVGLWG